MNKQSVPRSGLTRNFNFPRFFFWFYTAVLVFNATYPSLVLMTNFKRTSAAFVDVILDLIYSVGALLGTGGAFLVSKVFPTGALEVLSMLMPMTHILFVCRSIQEHAIARVEREVQALDEVAVAGETPEPHDLENASAMPEANSNGYRKKTVRKGERKLPVRKAVLHVVLSLTVIAVVLISRCHDRYPFKDDLGPCSPCVCDEAMVLQHCPLSAEIGDPWVVVRGRGVTALAPGVFNQYPNLVLLYLGNPAALLPTNPVLCGSLIH